MSRRKELPADPVAQVLAAPHLAREKLTPYVDTARDRVGPYVGTARDRVAPYVDTAREKLTPYVDTARDRVPAYVETARGAVTPYVETARGAVTPYVETARDTVTPYVDTARDKVTPYVEQARDWAAPRVEDARHRAAPVVADAVGKYVPKIEHALDEASSKLVTVLESTGPARYEVQRRGTAAVAALKGELAVPEEKSGRWGRRFLIVGLITGIGAAVFSFLRRRREDDAWITTDTTYPTYAGTGATTPAPAQDVLSDPSADVAPTNDGIGGLGAEPAELAEPSADALVTAELPVPIDDAAVSMMGDETLGAGDDSADPVVVVGDDAGGADAAEAIADATDVPVEPTTPDAPAERVTPKDVAEHIHPREV